MEDKELVSEKEIIEFENGEAYVAFDKIGEYVYLSNLKDDSDIIVGIDMDTEFEILEDEELEDAFELYLKKSE